MSTYIRNRDLAYSIGFPLIVFLAAFAFQGSRGLMEPDEGRYAECSREMLNTGNWLIPQLDGKPHLTKPPMTYWSIMGGMWLFGENEWGVRFFLVPAFVGAVLMIRSLGGMMWGNPTGKLAGWIYLTSIFPFLSANIVTADVLLTFWEILGVWAYWKFHLAEKRKIKIAWSLVVGIAFGLAFLTKGPPGLLPLPALIVHSLREKQRETRVGVWCWMISTTFLIGVGLWWYFYLFYLRPELIRYFWQDEVVGRIFTGMHHRNNRWYGAFTVYLPPLTLGTMPWCLVWLSVWPYRFFSDDCRLDHLKKRITQSTRGIFLGGWFFFPLLVFSLASSRLPLYSLPLFAPFSLATARLWERQFNRSLLPQNVESVPRFNKKWKWVLPLWLVILVLVKWDLAHGSIYIPRHNWDARRLYQLLSEKVTLGKDWELVSLTDASIHGLSFYSKKNIRYLRLDSSGSDGIQAVSFDREIAEMPGESRHHFLICEENKSERVMEKLQKNQIAYRKIPLVYGFSGFEILRNRPIP